jgi:semaphorin 6
MGFCALVLQFTFQGTYGDELDAIVYGVFTTPPNSIGGSAVCSYRLRDIFAGQFKEQRSTSDNWLSVEPHRVPSPRPGETFLWGKCSLFLFLFLF